jgi:2-oxoglutarate ferredoxin oxidoreductase subunit alpha
MDRLKTKFNTARQHMPRPVLRSTKGARLGIIAYGSTEPAILEAMHQLQTEHGLRADFLRVRAIPFTGEVRDFVAGHDELVVVEMNRDGQLHQLLQIEYPELAPRMKSMAFQDGLPATAKWVREGILAQHKPAAPRRPPRTPGKSVARPRPVIKKAGPAAKKSKLRGGGR